MFQGVLHCRGTLIMWDIRLNAFAGSDLTFQRAGRSPTSDYTSGAKAGTGADAGTPRLPML
jgi:hypothetical protein